MGWEDKFYYSQGKLRVHAPTGSTVSVYDANFYTTATAVDGKCDFTVPGTRLYNVSLNDVLKDKVSISFGEVKSITIGE